MFGRMSGRLAVLAAVLTTVLVPVSSAQASHSMGPYHWARTASPFTVEVNDNTTTAAWDAKLATAASDWAASSMLDVTVNEGSFGSTWDCTPDVGFIEVCNDKYGTTGWTGAASVYFDPSDHITKAFVKLNDTYLNRGSYPDAYDQLTVCQEIGHGLGLAHQDEVTTNPNLGSCMDYTNDADGPPSNEHPNTHDYDQLVTIYGSHLDSYDTLAGPTTVRVYRFADGSGVATFITKA